MDPDSSSEAWRGDHSARQSQSRRRGPEEDWDHSRTGRQVRPRQLESANQRPAAQAIFANSHHNSFIRSTINVAGGDQTNTFVEDSEAGLKLLYQAIAHVGAFHDSETRYPPPKCHPETRTAVLSDISSWIRGAEAETQVHWLDGPAGVGRGTEPEIQVRWLDGPGSAGRSEEPEIPVRWLYGPGSAGRNEEPEIPVRWLYGPGSAGRSEEPEIPVHLYGPGGAGRGAEAEIPVHWLYGPAGAGKSAIAQTLAEREQGNHLAASFFFSRSDPYRNNPKSLIMVISCCLAIWSGNSQLRAAIDSAVKTRPTILESAIEKQFQQLVIEPFKAIPKESWETLPRVVIIDGLDECLGSDSQRRVLTTLFGGLGNQIPLRFLIASRPEPVIRDFFGQLPHRGITTRTDLSDDYSTSRDIEVYLRDGFKAIVEESHFDVMVHIALPWPPIGVIHDLVQRASGQFIYASTVLKYVGEEYSHPVERLELVLGLPLGDPDAFSELDILYRQILLSNHDKARLIQILGTMLVLEDICSVRWVELVPDFHTDHWKGIDIVEQLLLLPTGAVRVSLRGMHSVLQIASRSVKFHHKSFLDFLFDARRSDEYFIDKARCHEQLARGCMKITNDSSDKLRSYAMYNCLKHIHLAKSTTDLVTELQCSNFCDMIGWYLRYYSHDSTPQYVSKSISVFQKYAKVLESHQIKTWSDSLQLGIYVTDTDRREISKECLAELELLFALTMDCRYAPLNAIFPHDTPRNIDILVGLGCTLSYPSMKEIFICLDPSLHSHSHSRASRNPIWHFIDFKRGYGRLAKCCLGTIRHNPCIKDCAHGVHWGLLSSLECGYVYAQSRMSELLHHSPLDMELQHKLKKTIPYLEGTKELHKVLLWLQSFPDDQRDIPMEVTIQQCSEQSHELSDANLAFYLQHLDDIDDMDDDTITSRLDSWRVNRIKKTWV
ncbi:hypothetical protein D9758_018445 [Tetrapyrgos nigripes]|uniref:Nephrocystin 3-like N-terminal domain-containing protein n=1 Tax=Tetrapyrgos nigripes TaxID=182062 RepID=A0A8H5F1M6_9AGAR|nr:hypothetical protein D9758_018445 [Tetrapyrgos nigripes]